MYKIDLTGASSALTKNFRRTKYTQLAFHFLCICGGFLASSPANAADHCKDANGACKANLVAHSNSEDLAAEGPSVFFSKLLDTSDFPARWHCGAWPCDVGWLHIISDIAIFAAYFAIPAVLLFFMLRKPELPFPKVIWLFAAFIFLCGFGHLIEASIFWWPAYRLAGLVKALTAVVSFATVFAIVRVLPGVLKLPTAAILATELQESKDRLSFAIEAAQIGIWEWDLKNNILSWDERTRSIFGIDSDSQLTFEVFVQRLHPDDRERVVALVETSINTSCGYKTEYRCIHNDGSVHHVRAEGKTISGPDGDTVNFIGICFDDTSQHLLYESILESESNFRSTFENAAMGIVHVALDGTCLQVNPRFCDIVMYSQHELAGSNFRDIVHPDDLANDLEHAAKALGGEIESYSMEKRYVRQDGTSVWVNLTSSMVRNKIGDPKHFVNVVENIQHRKEAEATLAEYTEQVRKLSLVASKTQHSVVISDAKGRIEWVNSAFTELTGYSSEEAIGRRPGKFLQGPDTDLDTVKQIRERLSHKQSAAVEIVNYGKSGEKYWVDLKIDPVLNEANELVQFIATQVNITERKKVNLELQKQRGRFESFLKSDIVGIATCRLDGSVEQANDEMLRIIGFSRDELIAGEINLRSLTPDEYAKIDANYSKAIIKEGAFKPFEKEFYRKDGSRAPVVVGATVIEGETDLTLCLALDATSRREVEDKLIEAKHAAEQSSQAKSEFLAAMSHELRTPLNGVIGMTELLADTELDNKQRRFVNACQSSGKALMTLISDILDFSKIEAGQLELDEHPFDLHELLEDVMTSMPIRVEGKNIDIVHQIDYPSTLQLVGDSHRLRQVIVNLMGNAMKFTEEGEISIHAIPEHLSESEATIRFTVSDTGIGIPEDRLHRLFRSFSQVDSSTSRRYGGSGLGLSISKSLIDAMNGTIGVESTEGIGSKFWFTVTFDRAQSADEAAAASENNFNKLKVLIVEKNKEGSQTLLSLLDQSNFDISSTTCLKEAFECIRRGFLEKKPFDVAIVNVADSNQDAMRFAKRVKAKTSLSSVKLILITAAKRDTTRTREYFDDCVLRPLDQSSLVDSIHDQCCNGNLFKTLVPENLFPELAAPDCESSNIRILLAEDNATNQLFASEILTRANWMFDIVGNGREAIDAVMTADYDVILMDCQMPEIDGFEATRQIRLMEANGRLSGRRSILALTANAIKGDQERCLDAGMDNYVAKPFHPIDLIAAIKLLLSRKENHSNSDDAAGSRRANETNKPPIDTAVLLDRCMGDIAFAESMLSSFAIDGPDRLSAILRQVNVGDAHGAGEAAHALKGIAGIVAAHSVHSNAAKFELLGRTGNLLELRTLVDELQKSVDDCLDYISDTKTLRSVIQRKE